MVATGNGGGGGCEQPREKRNGGLGFEMRKNTINLHIFPQVFLIYD